MTTSRDVEGLFPAGTLKACLLLALLFLLYRMAYYAAGVRFLDDLADLYQVADLSLLRTDTFRTILLLHYQPPLFNLFVGLVLKLAPDNPAPLFHAVYLLFGLSLTISLYLLGSRLGLSARFSFLLTLLFAVTPASVLLDNWAFYTCPVTVILVLAALALNLFVSTGKIHWLFMLFSLIAALVLTRSMFHPLLVLAIPVALFALLPMHRRKIVTAALVPLLVVGLWSVKNYYTIGSLSTSSLLGMNFSKITIMQLPGNERTRMYKAGEMSVMGLYSPFMDLDYYRKHAGPLETFVPSGIPIIDNERTACGKPNFNNPAYVDIAHRFMADDLAVLRYHPATYAGGVLGALCLYLQPPHDQVFSPDNVRRLGPLIRLFDVALYGQLSSLFYDSYHRDFISRLDFRSSAADVGLFVLAALVLVFLFWPRRLLAEGLAYARGARGITLWLMLGALLYVTLLANLVEIGENARLRYPVEPFLWLLSVSAVLELLAARKNAPGN